MAAGPQDASPHAGHVVRRVLLRRNIVIDAKTAQLVAAAVQAVLQAGAPSRPPRRGPRSSRRPLRAVVLTWHRLPSSFGAGDTSVNGSPNLGLMAQLRPRSGGSSPSHGSSAHRWVAI
jgi:hypothetical protein